MQLGVSIKLYNVQNVLKLWNFCLDFTQEFNKLDDVTTLPILEICLRKWQLEQPSYMNSTTIRSTIMVSRSS